MVKRFGEYRVALFGLIFSAIGALGYGLADSLTVVIIMMVIHAPEGFVMPMLQAMMTRSVPENAQGELQGGISAVMNVAALGGTVFFSQIFGFFLSDAASFQSPSVGFFVAAVGLVVTLGLFMLLIKPSQGEAQSPG
jgi:DHA1 family tetracycline resistance protein-like MFS transporter